MFLRLVTNVDQRKQKFYVPVRSSDAEPLSHGDSMVNKAHDEVQIRHTSCILLGSAMSIASCL